MDFNILVSYFKGEGGPKNFITFKRPLAFYRYITDGYATEENQKNQIRYKWNTKSEE